MGPAIHPLETDPITIIDTDGMPAFPITLKRFERITRAPEVAQARRGVQLLKPPDRDFLDHLKPVGSKPQSSASGSSAMFFSPAIFLSQYFRSQASQFLPAAVSRPVNARPAISE